MKSSKISQRRCISTPDIAISALSQHFNVYWRGVTLLFRSEPLFLPEKIVQSWKFQWIPILFEAECNGIIRWKLKSLADTIVVISFSQNSQTVWMGSPQAPKHTRLWYYRISSKTVYSATQNYSTEAVSIISTVRENVNLLFYLQMLLSGKTYFLYKSV